MTTTMTEEREGVFADIPDAVYHSSRTTLSSSGARTLLDDTPAAFRWQQDNPRDANDAFDLGSAVHTLVLGAGDPLVDIGFDSYNTNAAKAARDQAYVDGRIPLKSSDYAKASAMAAAVRAHPIAAALLADGTPELSLYHRDPATGVMLRARPDWTTTLGGRAAMVDLKTSADASPRGFAKSVDNFGYWQQQPWYVDAGAATGLTDPDCNFFFVVVDKNPPHLVTVHELDPAYVQLGRERNRLAIDIFHQCQQTGEWPGHPVDINLITAPAWRTKGQS
ncbi:PD-(D/E)XK nuclease-like domain-containing protein [Rhodococcoides corynebacterioides]|uniref:PD-(D/E)XK nuclease-like domain-containing protein n=1 Tax=Rhodococcoides corynebacterioides TaxID=53972 RepID=UPI003F804958